MFLKVNWMIKIALICFFYLLGMVTYKAELFPLNVYRDFFDQNRNFTLCPVVNPSKLRILKKLVETETRVENLIWGDSLIQDMIDPNLYGLKNFVSIGLDGQITKCALEELQYLISLKPKTLIIYLGGNDADRKIYTVEKAAEFYREIIQILISNDIQPIIHQIHLGDPNKRDRGYVEELNKVYSSIANDFNLKIIPPVRSFDFSKTKPKGELSADGEHLYPKGYQFWIKHIKENLNIDK